MMNFSFANANYRQLHNFSIVIEAMFFLSILFDVGVKSEKCVSAFIENSISLRISMRLSYRSRSFRSKSNAISAKWQNQLSTVTGQMSQYEFRLKFINRRYKSLTESSDQSEKLLDLFKQIGWRSLVINYRVYISL